MFLKALKASAIALILSTIFGASPASAEVYEDTYSYVGSWQILATFDGNEFGYCGAVTSDMDYGMDDMQILYDGFVWRIARNDQTVDQYTGTIFVGDWKDQLHYYSGRSYWIGAELNSTLVDALFSSDIVILDNHVGDRSNFSLAGSSRALVEVENCVRRRGR